MSYSRHCNSCINYKAIGEKAFCFKKNKVIALDAHACEDYRMDLDDEVKKRWIIQEKKKPRNLAKIEGAEKIKVIEKPKGSQGFKLSKKNLVEDKLFIDTKSGKEPQLKHHIKRLDQSQNLFIAVLIIGLTILIIVLFATGVI